MSGMHQLYHLMQEANDRLYEIEMRLVRIEGLARRAVGLELTDARRDKVMAINLTRLIEAARKNEDAVDGMENVLKSVAQLLRDTGGDQAKIDELATKLESQAAEVVQATVENTPFTPSGQ